MGTLYRLLFRLNPCQLLLVEEISWVVLKLHCLAQQPLQRGDGLLALVLAPTRELPQQIERGGLRHFKICCIFLINIILLLILVITESSVLYKVQLMTYNLLVVNAIFAFDGV